MDAFLLTVALILFWGFIGYAVLSAIYLKPNLLQNALLAPVWVWLLPCCRFSF